MRYELKFCLCLRWIWVIRAVPWLWRLVAGLSPRRLGFDPKSIHGIFLVDKVALGLVFLRVFPCQCHSTSATRLSSSACCSYQRDKRAKSGNLSKAVLCRKSGIFGWESTLAFSGHQAIELHEIEVVYLHLIVFPVWCVLMYACTMLIKVTEAFVTFCRWLWYEFWVSRGWRSMGSSVLWHTCLTTFWKNRLLACSE